MDDIELFAPMDDRLERIAQWYKDFYAENGEEADTTKLDNEVLGYIGRLDLDDLEKKELRDEDGLYITPKHTEDFALVKDGKVVVAYENWSYDDEEE